MATQTPARDWQHFYTSHPTPDPHSLSRVLLTASSQAAAAKMPLKIGAANAAVLVASIIAVAAH